MLGLLTNVNSLTAQNDLTQTMQKMNQNMQQLSTGKQINSAADNPAGLSISQRLQTQITGAQTGNQNIGEGIALSQTAEGGLQVIQNQLQKLRQLAIEAQNGTNSSTDVNALQQEANQILLGVNHIANTTVYNNIHLLNNTLGTFQQRENTLSGFYFKSIAFGNGQFVAVDNNGNSYTSTNGVSWSKHTSVVPMYAPDQVIWTGSEFAMSGYDGNVYTSANGVTWSAHATPGASNGDSLMGIAANGNQLVVADYVNNNIYTSENNGQTWTTTSTGIYSDNNPVLYANGQYLEVGSSGQTLTSSNGTTWTINNVPGNTNLVDAIWNGTNYVGIDNYGNLWTSMDGASWTKSATPSVTNGQNPQGIFYTNGTYYVSYGYYGNGSLISSNNLENWSKIPVNSSDIITGMAYGNGASAEAGAFQTLSSAQELPKLLNIQTGNQVQDTYTIQLSDVTTNALGIAKLNLTSASTISSLDQALGMVIYEQQKYEQYQTIFNTQQQNNLSQAINEKQAKSTITDANMTQQMSELTKNKILMQTDLSMLNQANQQSKIYLMLYNKPTVG